MDQDDKKRIQGPLEQLASADSDSLRASQRLFAQLVAAKDQDAVVRFAIEAFTGLNPPKRIQLLREIYLHLTQGRYPCLAFENNGRFF